ncbi:glycosyltransferase family 39 protein [Thauera sp. 63]|jgi:hypothetical protein|uniref:glycosyltransferase family 39 protein n=1 Tax=Thauera sp. 63 TaxID=497321 RepID=UPI0002CDE82C|nr:glycosyltransferase family 39 protein [Thauera sp. 63]ENO78169.1 glycosyl transferase family protein [Thauera sp. 63]
MNRALSIGTADRPQSGDANAFVRFVSGGWLHWLLVFFAALALFATPLQMMRLVEVFSEPVRVGISAIFAIGAGGFALLFHRRFPNALAGLFVALSRVRVWQVVVLGLVLRMGWIALFPAQAGSDGASYLGLAERLAEGGAYEAGGTKAYWPAGYPLFLVPWVAIFDDPRTAYLASNLVLFVVGAFGVAALARFLAGDRAGSFAALLFAVWPNLVFLAGTPEKEVLVLALLPWATFWMLAALNRSGRGLSVFRAGVLLGACTLVQPSLQFLPFVAAVLLVGSARQKRIGFAQALLVVLGAALVVAPWTYRNYMVFDTAVLVATNGGSNLYRANNSLATGGYTPRGEVDLSGLDELAQDKEGRRLAVEWIKANPGPFVDLLVEKQIRFMGDDAVGAYSTFKVGGGVASDALYAALKVSANAWWMLVWLLVGLFAWLRLGEKQSPNPLWLTPTWIWLYLFAIHSVFESAGKYHVPVLWVLCVLAGVLMTGGARQEKLA